MKNIKIIIIALLIISPFFLKAQTNDVLVLSLEKCRNMAEENSEVIKIAEENISKASGEKTAAKSAWLPNVSITGTGMYNKNEIDMELMMPTKVFDMATGELVPNIAINPATGQPIIGPDGNPVFNMYAYMPIDITIQGGYMASVAAEQPIYAGGKIIAGNRMASIGEHMAVENKNLKTIETLYEADNAYYTYLSVKEKVVLAKKYQDLLKHLVSVVEDSYQTGMINQNEVLKVQVQYNDASLQVQKAENGLKLAGMALCRVVGVDFNTQIEINDSIGNVTNSASDVSANAQDRIEYKLLQSNVEMAKQNIKLVQGDYLPNAGVSVGYNYFSVILDGIDNYDSHGLNAVASVKIPITSFGERKGKVKVAKADYNIKQYELQQAEEYLQLEIEQARLNLLDAKTRVEMTNKSLEQANENLRISQDNYNLGMETIVNLLEAQAEWQKAYANKIDALTDLKIKESNYLRVTNRFKSNN
ncbi:MAG TPA: TolC family protein [Bacteroidales bacterium]|nr:TolC family protein [Bacteroidales bacterium]